MTILISSMRGEKCKMKPIKVKILIKRDDVYVDITHSGLDEHEKKQITDNIGKALSRG